MKAILTLTLLSLIPTPAVAKGGTIGIYGIIDEVTFEPEGVVRISGVFVTPMRMSSGSYQPPKRGYLYFRAAPGREQEARTDWNDLKAAAGTGSVVGFTTYFVANPNDPHGNPHHSLEVTVRTEADDTPPELYPVSHYEKNIVTRGDQNDPNFSNIALQLRAASPK